MQKTIVLLPGDGIGPEVLAEAVKVLKAVAAKTGDDFTFKTMLIGGAAIDATGDPLPKETLDACLQADAVMLGAVGGPAWDRLPHGQKPESGLLAIRKGLNLFANLRPAIVFPELASLSCLRQDKVERGLDILVVRELTGDVYFGQPAGEEVRDGIRYAFNNMIYNEQEIRRIAHIGFEAAQRRNKRLCSVDKANVLASSRLWRAVVEEVHRDYPDVDLSHMYVDNCAMQLVMRPEQFDVILTGNIFGDILSDESAAVAGSLGMLPSASISGMGEKGVGLFEPIHGSAPDIAGQDKANPLAAILSAAMMLRMAFGMDKAAAAVEEAVRGVLRQGYRTGDIVRGTRSPSIIGCSAMGELVAKAV